MQKYLFRYNTKSKIFLLLAAFLSLLKVFLNDISVHINIINEFKELYKDKGYDFDFKYTLSKPLIILGFICLIIVVIILKYISKKTVVDENGIFDSINRTKSKVSWDDISYIIITDDSASFFSDYTNSINIFRTRLNTKSFDDMVSFIKNIASERNIECIIDDPEKQGEVISFDVNGSEKLKGTQVLLVIYLFLLLFTAILSLFSSIIILLTPLESIEYTGNYIVYFSVLSNINPKIYALITMVILILLLILNVLAIVYFIGKKRKAIKTTKIFLWCFFVSFTLLSFILIYIDARFGSSNVLTPYINIADIASRFFITLGISSYISSDYKILKKFTN